MHLLAAVVLSLHCLAQPVYPNFSTDGGAAVDRWTASFVKSGELAFQSSGQTRFPSPSFWGNEVVYSVMVDRFMNGNPGNDLLNTPPTQTTASGHIQDYRQGGDIDGITKRLDYLQFLGITTIWVSPILKHDGSFHGYCLTNPAEVDPGFGSKESLQTLTREAHKRHIKVVMDIVVNHLCDAQTVYSHVSPDHAGCANDLYTSVWTGQGGNSPLQGQLAFSSQLFPPFASQYFFSRCGANSGSDTSGQGAAAVFGDFVDVMFDFDTRNYDFQRVFTDIHKYWIAYADIDGYRLDAAKHVTEDFLAYFSVTIREYARQLGKDNFYIIGEVAADVYWQGRRLGHMFTNPTNPDDHGSQETSVPASLTSRIKSLQSTYLANRNAPFPGMNAVYNFQISGTARDVFQGKTPPSALGDFISGDPFRVVDGQADMRQAWTMLEIHDWPRFLYQRDDWWSFITAQSFLFTMPGQPIVYYGAEAGFNGDCRLSANDHIADTGFCGLNGNWNDVTSRQSMFASAGYKLGSAVPAIDHLASLGPNQDPATIPTTPGYDWTNDVFLNATSVFFTNLRSLIQVRKSCGALREGRTDIRRLDTGTNGAMIYSRVSASQEVVVMINTGGANNQISYVPLDQSQSQGRQGKAFVLLSNPAIRGTVRKSGITGQWELQFNPAYSLNTWNYAIFVPEANAGPWNSSIGSALCLE
ncbi:hypothetical protein HDV03_004895 [Kappamyces sp. JEL0829]|nr:hypothetical protein HDV03_004895 [Kappamyces sp. JEL0829]